MKFKLGEDELNFKTVNAFLNGEVEVELTSGRLKKLDKVRKFVEEKIDSNETCYGINTGFGRLANERIDKEKLEELQVNLIRSHAFGVGNEMDLGIVRLMMLLRAHVIAMGYSGVSPEPVQLLTGMLNKKIIPSVPEKGSVGASGDLAPLSYLALSMIGEGDAYYNDTKMPSAEALDKAGLKPARLKAKDGLTLINGTQAMTALAAWSILRAEHLIRLTDIVAALSIEGDRGSVRPFDPDLNLVRPQKGQVVSAEIMRKLLAESKIMEGHKDCTRVQDPYSMRCIPQVHGAARDVFRYASDVIACELNCCTDNPLVFPESGKIVSGGNFHGEPIAIACDALSIAMAELGSIAERRIEQLTNPKFQDIPVLFLTPNPGLNSGFMVPHVVASSLVSENKTLAHPASVDSIPTSAGQEDHVSMGMWAVRKLGMIIENVEWISVIEAVAACQAIDLHEKKYEPGKGTKIAYDFVRSHISFVDRDRWIMPEVNALRDSIMKGDLVDVVEEKVGEWKV